MDSMVNQSDSRQLATKSEGTTTWPENVISFSDHVIRQNNRRSVKDVYGVNGLARNSSVVDFHV